MRRSFNGAAPARARNVALPIPAMPPIRPLQRGRARAGAECCAVEGGVVGLIHGFNGAAPARARNAESSLDKRMI